MSSEAWGEPDDSPFETAIEKGWLNPDDLSKAVIDVMNERDRQWNDEKFDAKHDDVVNAGGQLAIAAGWYAFSSVYVDSREAVGVHRSELADHFHNDVGAYSWPWDAAWWKPKDRRADLVRAAALAIAEIERLDRAEGRE